MPNNNNKKSKEKMAVKLGLCFALALICSVELTSAGQCTDFTYDFCDVGACVINEVADVPDFDTCQFFCIDDETKRCGSVAYYSESKLCALYNCHLTAWLPGCEVIGGPKEPSLEKCSATDSGCDNYRQLTCTYLGGFISELHSGSAESCQKHCLHDSRCAYFNYEGNDNNRLCSMYSSESEVSCTGQIGPLEPEVADCDQTDKVQLGVFVEDVQGQPLNGTTVECAYQDFPDDIVVEQVTDDEGKADMGKYFEGDELVITAKLTGWKTKSVQVKIGQSITEQTDTITLEPVRLNH